MAPPQKVPNLNDEPQRNKQFLDPAKFNAGSKTFVSSQASQKASPAARNIIKIYRKQKHKISDSVHEYKPLETLLSCVLLLFLSVAR